MKDLYIVGCGGFGREVVDIVDDVNARDPQWDLAGFIDDNPSAIDAARAADLGLQIIGSVEEQLRRRPAHAVIGIGDGRVREMIDRILLAAGWGAATLVHSSATLGRNVTYGDGTIICSGVCLTTNIQLGRQVHINLNTTVGHDSVLEDYASVNPLVAISGNVHIGRRAMLGTHSAVLQNLSVGADAVVGGSALVTKDVPQSTTVKGVPAK